MPYIDKEKFRMHIVLHRTNYKGVKLTDEEKQKFTAMLDEVPTADVVERKSGKWIKNKRDGGWHCSCCGETDVYAFAYDDAATHLFLHDLYCPCCGAEMKGEDDETD